MARYADLPRLVELERTVAELVGLIKEMGKTVRLLTRHAVLEIRDDDQGDDWWEGDEQPGRYSSEWEAFLKGHPELMSWTLVPLDVASIEDDAIIEGIAEARRQWREYHDRHLEACHGLVQQLTLTPSPVPGGGEKVGSVDLAVHLDQAVELEAGGCFGEVRLEEDASTAERRRSCAPVREDPAPVELEGDRSRQRERAAEDGRAAGMRPGTGPARGLRSRIEGAGDADREGVPVITKRFIVSPPFSARGLM